MNIEKNEKPQIFQIFAGTRLTIARRRSLLYSTQGYHRVFMFLPLLFTVSWFMISCGNIRLGRDYRTAN
ncbi:MAG: hypothetical protein ACE5I0_09750, partial [Candidatus Binatia bacterium]